MLYRVPAFHELRIRLIIGATHDVILTMTQGQGQLMHEPMVFKKPYNLHQFNTLGLWVSTGSQDSIFILQGDVVFAYVTQQCPTIHEQDLPLINQLLSNTGYNHYHHNSPQQRRILIIGPHTSGKKTMVNRMTQHLPNIIQVNLDPTSSSQFGIVSIQYPKSILEKKKLKNASYVYGHTSPMTAPNLYLEMCHYIANKIETCDSSTLIVNTPGWSYSNSELHTSGYLELLDKVRQIFQISLVIVLQCEYVHQMMQAHNSQSQRTTCLFLKSNNGLLSTTLEQRIRHWKQVTWTRQETGTVIWTLDKTCIIQRGGWPSLSTSALPIGTKPRLNPERMEILKSFDLDFLRPGSILAVPVCFRTRLQAQRFIQSEHQHQWQVPIMGYARLLHYEITDRDIVHVTLQMSFQLISFFQDIYKEQAKFLTLIKL
jgi:hypothetical protein